MRPGVQVRRAVLCADGGLHYEVPFDCDGDAAVAGCDERRPECGPHSLGEQTVTTSEWQKVQP